jgi:GH24 family phage-related lysozyme (muramidase)
MSANRFLDVDVGTRPRNGNRAFADLVGTESWEVPFSAAERVLVVLIENGGVDLGIPALVDKLLKGVPGGGAVPDQARHALVAYLRKTIEGLTDNLLETLELTLNRYTAAKPALFGDVVVLRDGTASYQELKSRLFSLSAAGKIVDLLILTHGSADFISVAGGIDGQKIRAMKAEFGKPLTIRSVYMMNCVGSTLNQAWLDAGAKVSSGAIRNNYLPEPTTYFFWDNWKAGQTFENAATGAYRKTVKLMNDAIQAFLGGLPIPGLAHLDVANLDFVKDSAPVVQGQRSVTISSDALTFSQSRASSLATTVLPVSVLQQMSDPPAATAKRSLRVSPQGIDFIKGWEGFRAHTYNDPVGHCTVGYGTLLHTGNCDGRPAEHAYADGVTEAKATELLQQETAGFQQVISDTVSVPLNQNQNDALVSFVYNVGGGNFRSSTLLRLLNDGNYASVPAELKKWTKAHDNGKLVELPGLVKRRAAEAELFQRPLPAVAQSLGDELGQAFGSVDYSVPGVLEPLAQPTPRTCWATVITMMYGWRHQQHVDAPTVLATAGPQYVQMYRNDQTLDARGAALLYQALGLVTITSFNPTIDGWDSLLRKYGPLYVDVGYGTSTTTHAIIVTGISGDGSARGTSITYVDPVGGKTIVRKFSELLSEYEAPGAVNGWPHAIVHWPPAPQASGQQSVPVTHAYRFESPMSALAYMQNPAIIIAGMEVADAAQVGLAAVAIVQAQVSASQGSFSLSYDKAQRLLTTEARAQMPGAQATKKSYSLHLLHLSIGAINAASADIIVEWEGNPYGEIGTPVMRRQLATSTEWTKSSANVTITKVDRIPLPGTDPRTWPVVYTYEGTYDPYGNGYFEFSGEFELNAFGGLRFNRHEVFSRSLADWAIGGKPEDKVQRGRDVIVPVPAIPKEQIDFLRTRLP